MDFLILKVIFNLNDSMIIKGVDANGMDFVVPRNAA